MHIAVGSSTPADSAGLITDTPDPKSGRSGRFSEGPPDGYGNEHPDFVGANRDPLRLGGYKMILDGSPQARSVWMSDFYEPAGLNAGPGCAYAVTPPDMLLTI